MLEDWRANVEQMAKRMKFSVVGLPHYTIWHLYEPSVDDIRHMEEMENERKKKEEEERVKADRVKKVKEQFSDPNGQWEKDKADIKNSVIEEKVSVEGKAQEKPVIQDSKTPATPKPADAAPQKLGTEV